jgi:guanyl-specific ribonuclease Sa
VRKNKSPIAIVVSVLVAVLGFFWQQSQSSPRPITSTPATASFSDGLLVRNQRIVDQDGKVVFVGDVDLAPTLARVARGERDSHPNDGSVHRNREGKLPRQSDANYYTEYVVRTPKLRGVGPQRLILGKRQEIFYTPDHYQTFLKLR